MKNYYEFENLNYEKDTVDFYKSITNIELKKHLNKNFNDIEYYLSYYAEILKSIFYGTDYDEHYYMLNALVEELNDIKIILNILKSKDNYD